MKKLLLILLIAVGIVACQGAGENKLSADERTKALKDSSNFTTIQWLDSTFRDYGTVKEGPAVPITFRLKNTGSHNLIITDVSPSCGCTIVQKPEKPILPGEEYTIKAEFTTQGHPGENRKNINVTANTFPDNFTSLSFRVEVTK